MFSYYHKITNPANYRAVCDLVFELGGKFSGNQWGSRCMFVVGAYFKFPRKLTQDECVALDLEYFGH